MDMKSISQKLQDDIRAVMEANLHPNQQKIDVHEPEKDEITAHDFKKLRAMKKTKDGKVHNCATHVEHAVLGKGTTVSEQHATPDANGDIEWYTVEFETGTHQIATNELTITMSEAHMHESEQVDEEEKKKPVSPFDYKNYKSQIPTKPGETAGFDSKKISTGTVYTRKPVKEAMSHQAKTTMKHIPNASPALKKAAKDIKPGIAGIRDRFDMLDAGGVKREQVEQLDELSPNTLGDYMKAGHKKFDSIRNNTDSASMAKKSKLETGIKKAAAKRYPAKPSTPEPKKDPNSRGYEQGRYMGDSVEQDESLIEAKMGDTGWQKTKSKTDTVTDKSGAVHTAQSKVRDLARRAMKAAGAKQVKSVGTKSMKESTLVESRKTDIIKDAVNSAKKKKSAPDKFESEPVLDSQIQKVDNT